MARIGLLAGEGRLPIVFSDAAKAKGDTVIAFGLKGVTDPEIGSHVDKVHWIEWGKLKAAVLLLAGERINRVILLGKLKKELFLKDGSKLDDDAKKMLDRLADKKDYSLFGEAEKILKKIGIDVIDSTTYLKELIPQKGTLTKRSPDEGEAEDIRYGKEIATTLAGFDIGQTVTVRHKTVISVEAAEGTDEAIARAGSLAKEGFVAVKVARPDQDMRFDVPLVGPDTIKALIKAGGTALALEAGKTILMDREEAVKLADEKGVSVVIV